METTRIAMVAPYLHPHVGGVESHVEGVSAELARRGHDVTVVTSRLPGTPKEEARDGYRILRARTWASLFTTPITPTLGRQLAQARPDLVHAHSPPPLTSWFAARWASRARIPFVLTHHCDLEIPLPGGALVVETYRRTLGRATVARADALVATTRTYAQTSRSLWSRSDVRVVPNAVDARRFTPDAGGADDIRARYGFKDEPIALFVGRLTHHKGIEEFVRSAASTRGVTHLVVGDGPRRAELERLARETRSRVVFAGRVASEDLPAYYRAASLGVLPSTSRLEAFGIAALECMATARPVVVSDIPGVEEVIEPGETGLLAEPLDAADLGARIQELVDDPARRVRMGQAARARVLERFTLPRIVDELETVYAGALAARA